MKLRERLQKSSPHSYNRLSIIETQARQLLEYSQGGAHLTFTPHGLSHITAVENNYNWLLSDADIEQFNPTELFCLLCATSLHDAFMIPKFQGDEVRAREEHAKNAKTFLMKIHETVGLSIHEANVVSEIIRGHGVTRLDMIQDQVVIGNELVNVRKLAACLSVADICHADASRAPQIVFKYLELDENSKLHWRRHYQISGITRSSNLLIMSALAFSDEGEGAVREYAKAIEQQLATVRPYFETVLTPIKEIKLACERLESPLDQTLKFEANLPAILKLLIEGVYEREDVFVRELVQNALDACLIKKAKEMKRNLFFEPKVLLTVLNDQNGIRSVRVDDNGIGMDINDIQDTFRWIGTSISTRENEPVGNSV